jgi:hypothetical protein
MKVKFRTETHNVIYDDEQETVTTINIETKSRGFYSGNQVIVELTKEYLKQYQQITDLEKGLARL